MLLHHLKRITKLVQLGFALLVGKQTGLDHEIYVKFEAPTSCQTCRGNEMVTLHPMSGYACRVFTF